MQQYNKDKLSATTMNFHAFVKEKKHTIILT